MVNDVTMITRVADLSERDHQAQQEQQVIDTVEDVHESEADEAQRRLVPPRIQANQAGIAPVLERAHPPPGGKRN